MQEDLIKTAIIGIGAWGQNIARELALLSDLAAYASLGSAQSTAWALEHLPNAVPSTVEEICADSSIQAVFIATPTNTHAAVARQAIAAGKHVFIEKPTAQTAQEAQVITAEATKSNLVFATGYIFLYSPVYRELKRRVGISAITEVVCTWKKYGTFKEPIALNLLTHHLAIALDLLGEPNTVSVRKDSDNALHTTLTYENNTFSSEIDRNSDQKIHTFEVTLADGTRYLWDGSKLLQRDNGANSYSLVYESSEQPLVLELQSFLHAVQDKDSLLFSSGDFGAQVLTLLERANS
jgi:predicted dehydrogenase